jgi:hypothetical protein
MKTLLLPIDNRPVTYTFPQLIAQVAGIQAVVPPRDLMGSLTKPASIDQLGSWLEIAISSMKPVSLHLCLDTLLYGGLITSRRTEDTCQQVVKRAERIKSWKSLTGSPLKIFAQSSIMRISDNYDATEEKDYWEKYGREIFSWSEILHRLSDGEQLHKGQLSQLELKIPQAIRDDYLATRRRNFQVNQALLDYVQSDVLDYLAYSLDDSGKWGLNVSEQKRLMQKAAENNLSGKVFSYAGADEVLSTMIARFLIQTVGRQPDIVIGFSPKQVASCASRYEGQTIGDTLHAQLKALGLDETQKPNPVLDFLVLVHGTPGAQGDHIWLPGHQDLRKLDTQESVESTIKILESVALPCVICDVAYANGADPLLIEALLNRQDLLNKVWAYAGWNTTGNTIGTAMSQAIAYWFARKTMDGDTSKVNKSIEALKQALFIRLADDWAYQTQVRPKLSGTVSNSELATMMQPYLERIAQALDFEPTSLKLSFPWNRTFEVEIGLLTGQQLGVGR